MQVFAKSVEMQNLLISVLLTAVSSSNWEITAAQGEPGRLQSRGQQTAGVKTSGNIHPQNGPIRDNPGNKEQTLGSSSLVFSCVIALTQLCDPLQAGREGNKTWLSTAKASPSSNRRFWRP